MLKILNYFLFFHKHPGHFFISVLDFLTTVFIYCGLILMTSSFFGTGMVTLQAFGIGFGVCALGVLAQYFIYRSEND